jgi:TPR repeat protein
MTCGGTSWSLAGTKMGWPISLLLGFLSLGSVSVADLPDLKTRAAGGNPAAQVGLGIAYREGEGCARDYAQALAWFRKAAEKDDAAAWDSLGWMYEHGLGTTADLSAAARYYRASADMGHAQGQWNLGRMYAENVTTDHFDTLSAHPQYWTAQVCARTKGEWQE